MIAATNRPLDELKHDLLARFASRISIPPLETRREDIPLLVRSLLDRARASTPAIGPFFGPEGARLDPVMIDLLLRHDYTHELRELDRLLWVAASSSRGKYIAAEPELLGELGKAEAAPAEQAPSDPRRVAIEQALSAASGSVARAGARARVEESICALPIDEAPRGRHRGRARRPLTVRPHARARHRTCARSFCVRRAEVKQARFLLDCE